MPKRHTQRKPQPFVQFSQALVGLSLLSLGFFAIDVYQSHSWGDWYLVWNLFLAWIPLLLAFWLVNHLFAGQRWSDWGNIALTLAWLLFLPNSFYMVSDFIHLQDTVRANVLFDALMFTLFIVNGLVLGYTSLYLVQLQLKRHLPPRQTWAFIAFVILMCSFAIYLGRDLRWNSWDVLVNPAGIIFDISERLLHPLSHPETFRVTAMFFAFLGGLYAVVWRSVRAIRAAG